MRAPSSDRMSCNPSDESPTTSTRFSETSASASTESAWAKSTAALIVDSDGSLRLPGEDDVPGDPARERDDRYRRVIPTRRRKERAIGAVEVLYVVELAGGVAD